MFNLKLSAHFLAKFKIGTVFVFIFFCKLSEDKSIVEAEIDFTQAA
jgi:hypothetical protein